VLLGGGTGNAVFFEKFKEIHRTYFPSLSRLRMDGGKFGKVAYGILDIAALPIIRNLHCRIGGRREYYGGTDGFSFR
jgi:hypothetical protein